MKQFLSLALLTLALPAFGQRAMVVCDGDSLTYGTGSSDPATKSYSAQMYVGSTLVTNVGDAGELAADNTGAVRTLAAFAAADAGAKLTAVFCEGINDIAINTSAANVISYIDAWIASVRAAYPSAILVGKTLTDYVGMGGTFQGRVDTINTHILNTADFDYTIDLASNANLDDPSDLTYYDADGVHRTDAGYLVVAQLVQAVLITNDRIGTKYWVRTDGADTNDGKANAADTGGTTAQAWLTIAKAEDVAVSWDVVTVGAGRYDEIVTVNDDTNVIFQAGSTTTTNQGWAIAKSHIQLYGFHLNGSNVVTDVGVIDFQTGGNYCTVSNVSITGFGSVTGGALGVNMTAARTNNFLNRLNLHNPNGHAFTLVGRGHTVTNCTIYGTNGWDAFRIVASSSSIVNNTITEWSNPGGGNPNHTDLFQSFGDNSDIATNILIGENIVLNGEGCQLGNVTDDQENGDIGYWTWRNNVFAHVASTINLYSPNHTFVNNTFIRCATNGSMAIIIGSSGAGHANNLTIKNNIFYICSELPATTTRGWYGGDAVTGLDADYNLVIGTGAGTTKTGFTESNGINGEDPDFVSSSDFRLQTGSPAIGAGVAIAGVTTDILGNARPNTPSMGAYEGGFVSGRVWNVTTLNAVQVNAGGSQ